MGVSGFIQGAGSAPADQFATNTTGATSHNDSYRCNNGTNMATHMISQRASTRPTGHSSFHNNSPNSSDTRNGPTCFKCGEQGHMRLECREIFAHSARPITTTLRHAENNTTTSHAPLTARLQEVTTQQRHHHL